MKQSKKRSSDTAWDSLGNMFENIAYIGLGFAAVFLGLELACHRISLQDS